MTSDAITVLHALEGRNLTKKIRRRRDGTFHIQDYDNAYQFRVEVVTEFDRAGAKIPIDDVITLGQALEQIAHVPAACVIRGAPLPGTNLARCRRLLYDQVEEDGSITQATFGAAARRWIALDLDSLPLPTWNADDLTRRREAIAQDRRERPDLHRVAPKTADDGEAYDFAADGDPAPIDHQDWCILIRAAIAILPPEFEPVHAWYQFTSGHAIKPGIRLRLWYWLSRPVSDAEARRWLGGAPVDLALYSPVQAHYAARPIFEPPEADPVARRSGFWWRHRPAVAVPDLPEPPHPPPAAAPQSLSQPRQDALGRRAAAYADAVLARLSKAAPGDCHPAMRSAALTLYSLAEHHLLDPGNVTRSLLAIAADMRWPQRRINGLLDWSRATATANPSLPEGFQ